MSVKVTPLKDTAVFESIKVGKNELKTKIAFPPTTRFRALDDHTPSDLQVKYYDDRSKFPGTLLVSEGTFVSQQAGGYPNAPGIWTDSHVKGWKAVTDKVHANGSFISTQLWFLGRVGNPHVLKAHGLSPVSASATYESEDAKKLAEEEAKNPIRALTTQEVKDLVTKTYTNAALKAMEAGFDYVELHAAHGYLLDQFLQPCTNQRTDEYGGSIENRARLVLEIIDHLSELIGADKVAIRVSPWATFQSMKAHNDTVHPYATFSYLVHELQKRANEGKEIAYISVVEPRVSGILDVAPEDRAGNNDFIANIWKGVILKAGNYSYDAPKFDSLRQDVADKRTLVGFSRYFISNPDLVQRLHDGSDLTAYDRTTFYSKSNWGYNTYSTAKEPVKFIEEDEVKKVAQGIKAL